MCLDIFPFYEQPASWICADLQQHSTRTWQNAESALEFIYIFPFILKRCKSDMNWGFWQQCYQSLLGPDDKIRWKNTKVTGGLLQSANKQTKKPALLCGTLPHQYRIHHGNRFQPCLMFCNGATSPRSTKIRPLCLSKEAPSILPAQNSVPLFCCVPRTSLTFCIQTIA